MFFFIILAEETEFNYYLVFAHNYYKLRNVVSAKNYFIFFYFLLLYQYNFIAKCTCCIQKGCHQAPIEYHYFKVLFTLLNCKAKIIRNYCCPSGSSWIVLVYNDLVNACVVSYGCRNYFRYTTHYIFTPKLE